MGGERKELKHSKCLLVGLGPIFIVPYTDVDIA